MSRHDFGTHVGRVSCPVRRAREAEGTPETARPRGQLLFSQTKVSVVAPGGTWLAPAPAGRFLCTRRRAPPMSPKSRGRAWGPRLHGECRGRAGAGSPPQRWLPARVTARTTHAASSGWRRWLWGSSCAGSTWRLRGLGGSVPQHPGPVPATPVGGRGSACSTAKPRAALGPGSDGSPEPRPLGTRGAGTHPRSLCVHA